MTHHLVWQICRQEDIGLDDEEKIRKLLETCPHHYSHREKETLNIAMAWSHLKSLLCDDQHVRGLLDIEECIVKTHKILMSNLGYTGGVLSTSERWTTYKGVTHVYPIHYNESHAECVLWQIIDRYNEMITLIKDMPMGMTKLSLLVKLASWLIFHITSLHPFGDGNGRLSHLLGSYCLGVVFPIPTPICNIFGDSNRDHYIDAIVYGRNYDLSHLSSLILESWWFVWTKLVQ